MASTMGQAKAVEACALVCGDSSRASQLESVYTSYADRVYTLCLRLLADPRLAEAATAEVFSRSSRIVERSDGSSTLSCLRDLAFEETLIRLKRHPRIMKPAGTLRARLSRSLRVKKRPVALTPAVVSDLIVHLPDHLRVVFVLHDVEGLSDSSIAERLLIDAQTVRRRVHSARLGLGRLWLDDGGRKG